MVGTSFLVPVKDNQGQRFTDEDWQTLNERLIDEFGGFARASDIVGAWRTNDGRLVEDVSRQYMVTLDSWADFPTWLATMRWVREQFRQEAIHIDVAGVAEILER